MSAESLTLKDVLNEAQGFIFDCDGTLLDTIEAWVEAEADLYKEIRPLTDEEEVEIHSAPIAETARLFHEKYGVMSSTEEVLEHLDAHLLSYYAQQCTPIKGAVEFVRAAYQKGIPCVLVSSSPVKYLVAGLDHVSIRECFKEIISTEDLNISKSDPAMFGHALEVLGTVPEATWGVDDAPYAIDVMNRCGINTICVGKHPSDARIQVPTLEC